MPGLFGSNASLVALIVVFASLCTHLSAAQITERTHSKSAVIVVPKGWESATLPWQAHRASQGYKVSVVSPGAGAVETLASIRQTVESQGLSDPFIILGADATPINLLHAIESGEPYVPTFYMPSEAIARFGGEPEIATDYPYSDLDNDGIPECAVGRIPANNPDQLRQILQRTVDYEKKTIRGPWQYEMNLVAGIGGFSMLADLAIGSFTKAVLMDSLPKEFQLSVTQASPNSPYFPPPALFRDTVVNQLNRNSLLWVYAGHGSVDHLDNIHHDNQLFPILTSADVKDLKSSKSRSLVFLLACYSGAFDAPRPCLAELMLRHPQGPVAIVGASRVSMPYGMSVLGKQMLAEAFANHTPTIGEVLRNAKGKSQSIDTEQLKTEPNSIDSLMASMASALSPADHSLDQEILEHRYLMNLLGDPTLQLPLSEPLEFNVTLNPETKSINLKGDAKIPGELLVQVQYDRGRIPAEARRLMSAESTSKRNQLAVSDEDALLRYTATNDTVLLADNKAISKGKFNVDLKLPEGSSGNFLIRCTICNRDQSAVGVSALKLD